MMRFYRVGNRILNMAMLVDARYDGTKERLELAFSAPQPADVGACDRTFKAYEVALKGSDAEHCWHWLLRHGENLV